MSKNEIPKKSLISLGENLTKFDLVVVKDKAPRANTEMLDEYIAALIPHVDDLIANTLDVDIIESAIKNEKSIFSGFTEFRKGFTAPLANITKEFTKRENEYWKIEIQKLEKHKDKMLEKTFLVAEEAIRNVLSELNNENIELSINMSVFDSFILIQRKVKGMLPNDKGILGKASMTKIQTAFDDIATPIREAKEVEVKIALEHKQFQNYLPDTNSNNINELEGTRVNLLKQKETLKELYPLNFKFFYQTIETMIGKVDAGIRAIKAENEREEAETKRNALVDNDKAVMSQVEVIRGEIELLKDNKEELKDRKEVLLKLYAQVKLSDNKLIIKEIGESINEHLTDIELNEKMANVEKVEVETEAVEFVEDAQNEQLKPYSLIDKDSVIMDIKMMTVMAMSENDAIEKMVEVFRKSLIENGVQ